MTTRLMPLGNRLILRRIDSDTVGGIRMPDVAGEDRQTQECEVVQLPDSYGAATRTNLVVGDRVYLARHKGYGVQTNSGEELIVADAEDILCVENDVKEVTSV